MKRTREYKRLKSISKCGFYCVSLHLKQPIFSEICTGFLRGLFEPERRVPQRRINFTEYRESAGLLQRQRFSLVRFLCTRKEMNASRGERRSRLEP